MKEYVSSFFHSVLFWILLFPLSFSTDIRPGTPGRLGTRNSMAVSYLDGLSNFSFVAWTLIICQFPDMSCKKFEGIG